MYQTLSIDNGFRKTYIQFVIVVEMRERLAAVTAGGEAVSAARQRPVFDTEFRKSINQPFA